MWLARLEPVRHGTGRLDMALRRGRPPGCPGRHVRGLGSLQSQAQVGLRAWKAWKALKQNPKPRIFSGVGSCGWACGPFDLISMPQPLWSPEKLLSKLQGQAPPDGRAAWDRSSWAGVPQAQPPGTSYGVPPEASRLFREAYARPRQPTESSSGGPESLEGPEGPKAKSKTEDFF
jgi:hypothetical protein